MPTHKTVRYEYAADADSAAAILVDPDFLREGLQASGETNIEIDVTKLSDGHRLLVSRDVAAEVPALIRRFVRPKNRIVEEVVWSRQGDQWVARFEIRISGVPSEIRGDSRIEPTPRGSSYYTEIQVQSRVPLLGGKIEELVASRVAQVMGFMIARSDLALRQKRQR